MNVPSSDGIAPPVLVAGPAAAAERVISLDALRGFALLGILTLNIQAFSMTGAAYLNPHAYGDLTGANWWVWYLTHLFGDQKFMSIFSMLFGAGIALMSERVAAAGGEPVLVHYRRMGWLIVFGLLHAYLLWYGDILFTYGVCGLVAYPLRRLPVWALILLAFAAFACGSAFSLFCGLTVDYWPESEVASLEQSWLPAPEAIAAEEAAYRGGWIEQMSQRVPSALILQTAVFFLFGFGWKAGGLMLVGIALYRMGILTGRRSNRFYAGLAAIGLTTGLAIVWWGAWQNDAHGWDARYSLFFGMVPNFWASPLVSLGYIGLVMLACRGRVLAPLTRALAAVGRLAFSNYILQTLVCTTLFYGHGFGRFGYFDRVEQILTVFAVWVVNVVFSIVWLHYFRFGPLEWLWRTLTYWKVQPIVKRAPST